MDYMMEMIPVTSSNLKAVGYDAFTQELQVEFQNGGAYIYSAVPVEIFNALMEAKSVGRYFLNEIRGKFEARKV
jgi:hypothetical protein